MNHILDLCLYPDALEANIDLARLQVEKNSLKENYVIDGEKIAAYLHFKVESLLVKAGFYPDLDASAKAGYTYDNDTKLMKLFAEKGDEKHTQEININNYPEIDKAFMQAYAENETGFIEVNAKNDAFKALHQALWKRVLLPLVYNGTFPSIEAAEKAAEENNYAVVNARFLVKKEEYFKNAIKSKLDSVLESIMK